MKAILQDSSKKRKVDLISAKQAEINRLRKVLNDIANSQPNEHMDVEKNPELVNWICDTCTKARVGAYPQT